MENRIELMCCNEPRLASREDGVHCVACGKHIVESTPKKNVWQDADRRAEWAKEFLLVLMPEPNNIYQPDVEYIGKGRQLTPEDICQLEDKDMKHRAGLAVRWADTLLEALEEGDDHGK